MVIVLKSLPYTSPMNDQGIDLFSFFMFGAFLTAVLLAGVSFDTTSYIGFYLFVVGLFSALMLFESHMVGRREFSFYLTIPVLISATQNIYLGFIAPYASDVQIQVMVITNYLFSIVLIVILLVRTPYRFNQHPYQKILWLMLALLGYSFATIFIFNAHLASAFASLRNVMTPMLFLLIGLMASSNIYLKRFLKYIAYIALFVVIFGIAERFFLKDLWFTLHLPDLWTKKGIPLNAYTGLPGNFYSSEMVNGQQLRRMVSSFADPVNLGTFLFFGFMAAWYLRKNLLALALVVSFGLAVSKGAMLGFLVFCVVWAYHKLSKTLFGLVLTGAGLAGIAFILYSLRSSTMSMVLHFTGFIAAFEELIYHPIGRGLGNIGVLAGLYSSGAQTEITESGLGMIIGQLGIVGLLLFINFFWFLWKRSQSIQDKKDIILAQTLILSILLNIMFNEVALSPNSSAVYFMAIGILLGQWYENIKHITVEKKKKYKFVW